MRAVVQRVRSASVETGGRTVGAIGPGALVLLGVARSDTSADAAWLAGKISRLRIHDDAEGRLNCSIAERGGAFLVVSQFTLIADCRKGNRPSYIESAPPEQAEPLYGEFVAHLRNLGHEVQTGVFRAAMQVALVNDGPVTIVLDTPPPAGDTGAGA